MIKLKIIKNPDNEMYEKVTKAVEENMDFCPCLLEQNEDTKCVCKDFREQDYEGFCHCLRFKKILD
jgi:hypothetical protein